MSYTSIDFVKKTDYYGKTPIQLVFSDSLASSFLKNKISFKLTPAGTGKIKIIAKQGWTKLSEVTVS